MQITRDPLEFYKASYRSKESAIRYSYKLLAYANRDLLSLLRLNQREAEDRLIDFIITEKEKGTSWGSLHNYVAAVARFYLINDIYLNLKRVKRFMPEQVQAHKDRAYTDVEIKQLLDISNEKSKALILLLATSGIRIQAASTLRIGDLEDRGNIYKITVYAGTTAEYYTFCSPEAKQALDNYFDIRTRHGETITPKSPVFREQYDKMDVLSIKYPKFTRREALSKVLEELLERSGLRIRMQRTGKANRPYMKDVKLSHGFRKFFNTQLADAKINPLVKELLMGHRVGLEENYYRPTEEKVQREYESAIDALTIDPSKRLQRKVEMLTVEKSKIDLALSEIAEMKKTLRIS